MGVGVALEIEEGAAERFPVLWAGGPWVVREAAVVSGLCWGLMQGSLGFSHLSHHVGQMYSMERGGPVPWEGTSSGFPYEGFLQTPC